MLKKCIFPLIMSVLLALNLRATQPLEPLRPAHPPEISLIDYDGTIIPEKFSFHKELKFFSGPKGKLLGDLAKSEAASKLAGWAQNNVNPFEINRDKFIRKHQINMKDFIVPPGGYKNFNEFFTRKLKPGARTVDQNPGGLVSPADSKCTYVHDISKKDIFIIKNSKWSLARMLTSSTLADLYEGGTLISFRLAPEDYHRFHFPCDAVPGFSKKISGAYNSVNPYVFKQGDDPLGENARSILVLKSEEFQDPICIIVGAMGVGKIVETYTPSVKYKKGDEMGYFKFGASTVCLLFRKGVIKPADEKFIRNSEKMIETAVKQGQLIALKAQPNKEEPAPETRSFFDFSGFKKPLENFTHLFDSNAQE